MARFGEWRCIAGNRAAQAGEHQETQAEHVPVARHPQELTDRDRKLARGLVDQLAERDPEWASELEVMLAAGRKADVEGVAGSLVDHVLRALEHALGTGGGGQGLRPA